MATAQTNEMIPSVKARIRHFREIQWSYDNGGNLAKIQRSRKPVSSYRISAEGTRQLKELAKTTQRSEANVVEIAIDRMYREEIRFRCLSVHEAENKYNTEEYKDEK